MHSPASSVSAAPEAAARLEARLAELRATNERAWMEALFREFYGPLGRVIKRVVRDQDATEDLLQDVFARVWNQRASIEIGTSWRAYLHRAALNAALRYQERAGRSVALDDAPPTVEPHAPDSLADLHHAEAQEAVAAALSHLPPQCRTVFELSRFEEMSYREIADTLEISPKTVENQMGKALRLMREHLGGLLRNLHGWLL